MIAQIPSSRFLATAFSALPCGMPLPRQRAQYSPHRLRLRARQLQENTSRFFSLLLSCRDADTDDIDVPDCLLRGVPRGVLRFYQ